MDGPHAVEAMVEPVDAVEAMVERIAPAHAVLSQSDVSKAQVLAVMVPEYMRKTAKTFVQNSRSRPALMIYGSDLTPMLLNFRRTCKMPDSTTTITRSGKSGCEWNVHQCFFLWADDLGVLHVKSMIEPPVLMSGKRGWYLFAVTDRFCPLLPKWHPDGISLSWYVFDRGCLGVMDRLMGRKHRRATNEIADADERMWAEL